MKWHMKVKQSIPLSKMFGWLISALEHGKMALHHSGGRGVHLLRFAQPTIRTIRVLYSSLSRGVQEKLRSDAKEIFCSALKAVTPQQMVTGKLSLNRNVLRVMGKEYAVDNNVSVVAFGKAVLGMAKAVEDILGQNITRGVASIPFGLRDSLKEHGTDEFLQNTLLHDDSRITVIEGAKNNLPDKTAQFAASKIKEMAEYAGENDVLLVLISGGGSALLPFPVHGITLEEKLAAIKSLASAGATITELNTVRKNLSALKGGKLAQAAYPAKVLTLILSDVIGDPLDIIASGPTVPDHSTPTECLQIFRKMKILDKIPVPVLQYLKQEEEKRTSHVDISSDFDHVQNVIVGSNRHAVDAAVDKAMTLGYTPIILSTMINGIAKEVGCEYADLARYAWSGKTRHILSKSKGCFFTDDILSQVLSARSLINPICFIGAGETTVNLQGSGIGGRNQEMSLSLAIDLHNNMQVFADSDGVGGLLMLSAGTDGQDGPNPAAGAIAEPCQVSDAAVDGLDAVSCLDNNDSYTFYSRFQEGKDHVITGLTGTNVMDIQILLVSPPVISKNVM